MSHVVNMLFLAWGRPVQLFTKHELVVLKTNPVHVKDHSNMPPPTLFNSTPYGWFLYLNIELGLHPYPCKLDFRLFWEYSGPDPWGEG